MACANYPKHFRMRGPCPLCGHDPADSPALPSPTRPTMIDRMAWLLRGCVVVGLVWLVFIILPKERARREQAIAAASCPAAGFTVDLQSGAQPGGIAGAPAAVPGQRRSPCDPEVEMDWNGLCWLKLARLQDGRCPKVTADWMGHCLAPSLQQPRAPTSISQ
jgi:hypothetical protein